MKFIIKGEQQLRGEVAVQGSKNAAFPVLAACLLCEGKSIIENVPEINDVKNFVKILEYLGAKMEFKGHKLTIDPGEIQPRELTTELVTKLRGSVVLAGACLARFGKVKLVHPGGDSIGKRPIDVHLEGFKKLGAEVVESGGLVEIFTPKLNGSNIVLGVPSVTGTENLILAATGAYGITEIHLAATEPHVQNLCRFLVAAGAKIEGIGTPLLKITGAKKLKGVTHILNYDEIDALTFCVAGAASHGEILIKNAPVDNMDAPLHALEQAKVDFSVQGNTIQIKKPQRLYAAARILTGVYPQLLTDDQPLLGVLATQAHGETFIHDWIYEGRQEYLKALQKMGAKVKFDDVHRARIFGPTTLHGTEIKTPDIRAGASILIAALIAKGRSVIYNAEIIDRGYERIDERLNSLGAKIQRIE